MADLLNSRILSILTFLPLVAMLVVLLIPNTKVLAIKIVTLVSTGLVLVGAGYLYAIFNTAESGLQFVERATWIPAIGASYFMAVDGISLPVILVTALLVFVCIIASWNIQIRPKEYFALFLLLEVGSIGVFLALDLILFYVFWELVLVPMYFLIGIWGGPRKEYAAIKFFLFTLTGSIFMLLGILAMYFYAGIHTFDMFRLAQAGVPYGIEKLAFLAFFLGFAVKVPMFPLHTWLPDAHVEAPTAASVILAGVLLKMGTYAFVRIGLQLTPRGFKAYAFMVAILGVISIIYGAMNAMVQKDLKKLVAYSSISHMGYVMLGISSMTVWGVTGAVLYMFNHGIITGMLFLTVGLIYDRVHTREIGKLGGFFVTTPVIGAIWAYIALASLGLPSLSGFVSEFLVLTGSFNVYRALTGAAAVGIVITAGYMLWTIQRVAMGEEKFSNVPDATPRELSYAIPMMAIILVAGVYPAPLVNTILPSVKALVGHLGGL